MNVLITGASGLVGTRLTEILLQKGFKVGHIGRKKTRDARVSHFVWNPKNGTIDIEAIDWADAVINLSGASVSEKRWTDERKKEIIESRTSSLRLLARTFRELNKVPSVVVSASGVGWYGTITEETVFKEDAPANSDFFGQCCKEWEGSADLFSEMNARLVKLRIGVVLSNQGGAYPKLAAIVRSFIGAPLGSGRQWMPWIHIDDLCYMMMLALTNAELHGVYNAAAPQHVTNKEFMKALGRALHRPVFLPPVPSFMMKLMLGEKANMLIEGSRVSSEKIRAAGFEFCFERLEEAMIDVAAK